MRLTILGSSGGYPGPNNPTSGFLVEHAGGKVWLDAGHGTFSALQRATDCTKIDAVLVSHVHADHCVDLHAMYVAFRFRVEGVLQKRLCCPREVWERVPVLTADPPEAEAAFRVAFDVQPIDAGDVIDVAGFRVSFLRTDHPNHCLAMRLESGEGILTYSADTGPNADLAGFARGSDLLLCEATYQEGKIGAPVHLSARQAAETAVRAGVRDLVLTHVWPTFDPQVSVEEARGVAGDVRVEWAAPGVAFAVRAG